MEGITMDAIHKKPLGKVISLVLALLLAAPYAFAGEIGRVTYVEGRADLFRPESPMTMPLREGDTVSVGDAVRTKSQSKIEIAFDDTTLVRLAANSKIEIQDYQLGPDKTRTTATIRLDRGKIRTIIAKMAHPADFNIATPNAKGTVKGSDIFAFYQAGNSGMLVSEGELSIANISHPENLLVIPSGNSVLVGLEDLPKGPRPYFELEKKLHESDTSIPPQKLKAENVTTIRGTISKLSGDVRITAKGTASSRPASINDILQEGDTIQTGSDGLVEIRLDNGNVLNLKQNTHIEILSLIISDPKTGEYINSFYSTKGEIRARVEGLTGRSSFTVKSPSAVCGARGTIMYLEINPVSTRAFFEGGAGFMQNVISGLEKAVEAGYNSTANSGGSITDPLPTTGDDNASLGEGWEPGSGVEGYSAPEGTVGVYLASDETGALTIVGREDLDTSGIGGTEFFGDLPFEGTTGTTTTVEEEPLTSFGTLYGETSRFDTTGALEGVLGLTNSFWNNGTASFLSLGDFTSMTEGFEEPFVWRTVRDWGDETGSRDHIYSYNPETQKRLTYDGGAFYGLAAGSGINGAMDGFSAFLYIDPQGNAGTATGDLAGIYSLAAETYLLGGYLTGEQLASADDVGIDPQDLSDSIFSTEGDGLLAGSLGEDGLISANEGLATYSIVNGDEGTAQTWGVYAQSFYGEFYDPSSQSTEWSAVVGGNDPFGAYYYDWGEGEGDFYYDYGYWIASIDGGRWSNDTLDGTVNGYFITYNKMGALSGKLFGMYEYGEEGYGSWEASGAGVWIGDPLTLSGEWGQEVSSLYSLDSEGGYASWAGEEYGLIGAIEDGWWDQDSFPILAMGEYYAYDYEGERPFIWKTPLQSWNDLEYNYTTLDGGAFDGYTSGVWNEGSMTGAIAALFSDDEGRVGLLRGPVSGGYYADLGYDDYYDYGMWMATGTLYPTFDPSDSGLVVDPANLEYYKWYGGGTGYLAGAFDGSQESLIIASDTMRTVSLYDPDGSIVCPWGIFTQNISGSFSGKPDEETTWSAHMGGFDSFGSFYNKGSGNFSDDEAYWLCDISGVWKANGELYGRMTGTYLSENYLGLNGIEGDLFGVNSDYSEGDWIGTSVGSWQGVPLTLAGFWGNDSLYREYNGSRDYAGYESGFIGSIEENWWEKPFDVIAMGEYRDYDYSEPYIWDTPWYGNSNKTDERGDLEGYSAGVWANGIMTGAVACLFANPDGVVGFFRGLLSGAYYLLMDNEYRFGMWVAQGRLTPTLDTSELRIYLPYFGNYIWDGGGEGHLAGAFGDQEGFIQATDSLQTKSFYDRESSIACPWGIYRQEFTGSSVDKPELDTTWRAALGGYGSFGAYYNETNENFYSDYGYWLSQVSGDWKDNQITGGISGDYLTYTHMGSIEGDLFGVYDDNGRWIATSVGSWQGNPLTLSGEWGGESGSIYYNNNGYFSWAGDDYGLIGSITAEWWNEESFPVLAIGDFYIDSGVRAERFVWNSPLQSYNAFEDDSTTLDGGAFFGVTAGLMNRGLMDGAAVGFYINADGEAGIFDGNLEGSYYPEFGMWKVGGVLYPHDPLLCELDPQRLYYGEGGYIEEDSIENNDGLFGYFINGDSERGGLIQGYQSWGYAYNLIQDEGLCIFDIALGNGNRYQNPDREAYTKWEAFMGGCNTEYMEFWLNALSGTWENDEIRGTLTGMNLNPYSLGRLNGYLFGVNNGEEETWIGSAIGTFEEEPLYASGLFWGDHLYYDPEDDYLYDCESEIAGVIGTLTSPYAQELGASQSADLYLMGETSPFNTPTFLAELDGNYAHDEYEFMGLIGGHRGPVDFDEVSGVPFAGSLALLYIDEDGNGGMLEGLFGGDYYSALDLFSATGTLTGTRYFEYQGEDELSFDDITSGPIEGYFCGSFKDGEGADVGYMYNEYSLSEIGTSEHASFEGQMWGIWEMELGGYYEGTPTDDWTLYVGGLSEPEGEDALLLLATIDGISWEDGLLSGTVTGKMMSPYILGHLQGNAWGSYDVYDYGLWEAVALGSWQQEELLFVSPMDTMESEDGFFYAYDYGEGLDIFKDGDFRALLGGVESLWSGTPTAHFMGEFEISGESDYYIWTASTSAYDFYTEANVAYEGGSYCGVVGGAFQVVNEIINSMRGLAEFIYIDPDGTVGVLSGELNGYSYPFQEVFDCTGVLTRSPTIEIGEYSVTPGNLGIDPADLADSISDDGYFESYGETMFDEERGVYAGWDGMSMSIVNYGEEEQNQGWGIWGARIIGEYMETPDNRMPSAWELPFIGLSFGTDWQTEPEEAIVGSMLGILAIDQWADNNCEGTTRGIYLSLGDQGSLVGGVFVGDSVGNYVDVEGEEGVGTWQAVAAGEWADAIELEEALNLTQIDSMVENLGNLVNIPIDIVYSSIGMAGTGAFDGGGGITVGAMDMSFYAMSQDLLNGIWAALISGTYTSPASDTWSATVSNEGCSATLTGTQWSDNQWQANVNGSSSDGISFTGAATGTYNEEESSFNGVGTGTWNQEGGAVEG